MPLHGYIIIHHEMMCSVAKGRDNEWDSFHEDGWLSRFERRLDPDNIFIQSDKPYWHTAAECSAVWCLSLSRLNQIIMIRGAWKMWHTVLSNNAKQIDTMIRKNYDWKLIVSIVKKTLTVKKFSMINIIAPTDLKIWDLRFDVITTLRFKPRFQLHC